ncbi:isocitrate/isopropylmalate family dehydrogenase, partial [Actinomadura adrarensis]
MSGNDGTRHRIALIPGDGIGREVVPAARRVLDAVCERHGLTLTYTEYDWSCERYEREGAMMPDDALDRLAEHDAILLGAVGYPGVPDHVSLWGLLIPIRRRFQQYVNLRPIKVFEGLDSPLRTARPGEVDFVVVRENVEGEYSEIGGRIYQGTPQETAVQESVFTRAGVTRILDYAFDLAGRRRGYVTSATKSNGIVHTMPFWDELVRERAAAHPDITWDQEHIDALAAKFVLQPGRFDVVVGSNLFGDIITDIGA